MSKGHASSSLQASGTSGDLEPRQELENSFASRGLLGSLLKEPKYSDLTIICHSRSFSVHKCIVCPRSAFFTKACDGKFREGISGEITLDEDPLLVKKMVEYLYLLDYKVTSIDVQSTEAETPVLGSTSLAPRTGDESSSSTSTQHYDSISFHILMYSLADRLLIHGLKSLAKMNLKKELCLAFNENSLRKAVIETYNTTPENERGLRDLIVELTINCLPKLGLESTSGSAPLQYSLFEEVPAYAGDLLRAFISLHAKRSRAVKYLYYTVESIQDK